MDGVAVVEAPKQAITKSDLFTQSGMYEQLAELTRPAYVTAFEQFQAMERQRRKDLFDKISGRSATLEWADRMKTVALGTMPANLLGKAPASVLSGFGPAAEAFKRWEQSALVVLPEGDLEPVPLAPVPIQIIAPQPIPEPNHADLIAELEKHELQLAERWMAVFDRERIRSMSDKEAALKAVNLIEKNEGEKPIHVWTVIKQALALRTHGEQAVQQAVSKRAAQNASMKNAEPRAWVQKEWENRSDLGQSKSSFARQYVLLVKQRFSVLVTDETIKRDWLPKSGK